MADRRPPHSRVIAVRYRPSHRLARPILADSSMRRPHRYRRNPLPVLHPSGDRFLDSYHCPLLRPPTPAHISGWGPTAATLKLLPTATAARKKAASRTIGPVTTVGRRPS
ncbi:hypothetical protein GW17_00042152 [Ensete ventricosum]|nr:hypothetical protein GW17_00042152 [Ensete ventricosum]